MRILFVNYEYPPLGGGGGNATREIARALLRRGHQAAVLTTRFGSQPAAELDEGIQLFRLATPRRRTYCCSVPEMIGFMAGAYARGRAHVASFRPEVTLGFFALPVGPAALRISRQLHIPCAICLRGGDVPGFAPSLGHMYLLSRPLLRYVWRHADAVVANSHGLARLSLAFEPNVAAEIIPNGIDAVRFHPAPPPKAASRGITILTAGRLAAEKGLAQGIRSLMIALAPSKDILKPPLRLLIAGDGPSRAELESEARRLDLENHVEFLGWRDKEAMPEIYRQADIFAHLSRSEGCPNAVLEAMASGLAVLATRANGTEDLITHEKNGMLIDYGDQAALEEATEVLLADAALRARLAHAARESAQSHSWDSVAASYEALCARLIKRNRLVSRRLPTE